MPTECSLHLAGLHCSQAQLDRLRAAVCRAAAFRFNARQHLLLAIANVGSR